MRSRSRRRGLAAPLLPLFMLALSAVAAACTGGDGDDPASPRVFVDSTGVEVTFDAPPQRIISYSPGATEILFAIGAGDRVVATDDFSDYPAAALELPRLTYINPDPEAALAHDPDLVVMASAQAAQVSQFRDLGMTVIALEEPASIEGVYGNIALLGEITGEDERAAALVEEMRARIDAVTAKIAGVERGPRVYFELDASLFTVAPQSFVGGLLEVLKASNVAEGAQTAFPQLTAEALIAADPEVILLANAAFGESAESVAARPGWSSVSAVVSGRIFAVNPDTSNRPGPRIVEAIEEMAKLLYPDRFE